MELSGPDAVREMEGSDMASFFRGNADPAPEAEREPELETVAVDPEGVAFPAGVALTRSQPRRGGRRVQL